MGKRGFTFIEILVVMILIGVLAVIGIPRLRGVVETNNVRGARVSVSTLVAKGRAAAVQRGCRATLHFSSGTDGTMWLTVCKVNANGLDTLGGVERIASRFNVTFTADRDSMAFDPRGISTNYVVTTLRFTSNAVQDSIMINRVGKVVR
jgi:prepilin-type N-terminal cleavage/methylation domain-containing protein